MKYCRVLLVLVAPLAISCLAEPCIGLAPDGRRPLQIRLYSSLFPGIKASRARVATRPMVDLLSEKVDYPIQLSIEPAFVKGETQTPRKLLAFAAGLKDSGFHIAALWGIEFGWLRQRKEFADLEPLILAREESGVVPWRPKLLVRKDQDGPFGKLKGKSLAVYATSPLVNRHVLQKMIQREEKTATATIERFFKVVHTNDVLNALDAVTDHGADCVLLELHLWNRILEEYPARYKNAFSSLEEAEAYTLPQPALVGFRKSVERLRKGLWKQLANELAEIHKTPEGKECIGFWRFDRFVRPDTAYLKQIEMAASYFSLE